VWTHLHDRYFFSQQNNQPHGDAYLEGEILGELSSANSLAVAIWRSISLFFKHCINTKPARVSENQKGKGTPCWGEGKGATLRSKPSLQQLS
jgi:hypothetical protein